MSNVLDSYANPVDGDGLGGDASQMSGTCRHCGRAIVHYSDGWGDPEARGEDSIWRLTCDAHDTFIADHEPVT